METIPEPQLPEGYFYHHGGYLWRILPTDVFSILPDTVAVNGEVFQKKQEFHVTVANVRAMAQEIAEEVREVESIETSIQKLLIEYLQGNRIFFEGFEENLRLAATEEQKSIAAVCRMRGIEDYFVLITETYGKEFPLQPAHVSIYTVNGMAVAINSNEQMESYNKVVLPEIQIHLNSITM